jgi:hypothetical protein
MRSLVLCTVLLAIVACSAAARDESVDELKARAKNALPQDRPGLCVQVAELQLHNADKLYRDGDVELGRAAVDDIVAYSEQARDSAIATKKRIKNVEIAVRKMAVRLRDIKHTLSVEEQPKVDQAVQRLEEVRTSLLKHMFSKEKK